MADDVSNQDGNEESSGATSDAGDEFTPITSQEDLDARIGKRLERERAKFADYDDLKAKAAQFDELEEQKKSELQKITERAEAAEREKSELESRVLRSEIASKKGLTPAQAARLQGSTAEELESDADELLEMFKPQTPQVRDKPRENLRGGGDPDDPPQETDPMKLAAQVPRL